MVATKLFWELCKRACPTWHGMACACPCECPCEFPCTCSCSLVGREVPRERACTSSGVFMRMSMDMLMAMDTWVRSLG